MLKSLAARFPNCFAVLETRRRPLKVGIDVNMIARGCTTRELVAIKIYVNSAGYLRQMKSGAERIDLDGNPAGIVDEKAAEHSHTRLLTLALKWQAHRRRAYQIRKGAAAKRRSGQTWIAGT